MKKNKTALITGASSGIGMEFAEVFARNGYDLVLVARDEDKLEAVSNALMDAYDIEAFMLAMDLTKSDATTAIIQALEKEQVEIDVLVNNAGVGDVNDFASSDIDKADTMIHLNIHALTMLTRKILPGMVARKHGKILNVASVAAFFPGPFMSVYYATKAYVLSFSEALAEELQGTGVQVSTLCPGATKSGFQKEAHFERTKLQNANFVSAKSVAEYGYKKFMQGKQIVIPGFSNKLLVFSRRFMPVSLQAKLVRKVQALR